MILMILHWYLNRNSRKQMSNIFYIDFRHDFSIEKFLIFSYNDDLCSIDIRKSRTQFVVILFMAGSSLFQSITFKSLSNHT